MANAIDREVAGVAGKAALAMEGFARALRQMPATIADNGGLDSAELVTQLRAAHHAVRFLFSFLSLSLDFFFSLFFYREMRLLALIFCLARLVT